MGDQTITYDAVNTLNSNKYSLIGWTFQGWATSSTGSVSYLDQAQLKNSLITSSMAKGAVIHLYAKWKQNTFTVRFVDKETRTYTYDAPHRTPPGGPSLPAGRVFDGWKKDANNATSVNGGYVEIGYNYHDLPAPDPNAAQWKVHWFRISDHHELEEHGSNTPSTALYGHGTLNGKLEWWWYPNQWKGTYWQTDCKIHNGNDDTNRIFKISVCIAGNWISSGEKQINYGTTDWISITY